MARKKGNVKSVLIATRVTPRIYEMVKQMAHREGYYVSEWVRKIITNELLKNNMLNTSLYVPSQKVDSEKDRYSYPAPD